MARAGRRANGEGAPRQRADGLWEIRFYVTDALSGERKRVSVYGKRRGDAIARMHEKLERAEKGAPLTDATASVGRWIEHWCDTTLKVLPISDGYRDQTRNLARVHLTTGPFSTRRLDQLRPSAVEALIAELTERQKTVIRDGRAVEVRALADSTIRSIFLVLRKALDGAVRDGLIARNPAAAVHAPKVPRRSVTKLDPRDVTRLLEQLETNRYYAAYAFIATTAARRGETLALEWSDIDLTARVAGIDKTLSQVKGGVRLSPAKTDGSRRKVLFPEPVAEHLRAWRKRQAAERLRAGDRWAGSNRVFTTSTGGPVSPRNFLRALQDAAKKLELPDGVGVHTLRHSAATAMLEAGIHVKAVADAMGHSSAQITLDIYGFTADKVALAAADGLADAFGLGGSGGRAAGGEPAGGNVVALG